MQFDVDEIFFEIPLVRKGFFFPTLTLILQKMY